MPKIDRIEPRHVRFIPERPEPGLLYIADEFGTASHLCCCGCGNKVVTPLGPAGWSLHETTTGVSLYPSIGNWSLECRSHYWIKNGAVRWSYRMSKKEIDLGRRRDDAERRRHFDKTENPSPTVDEQKATTSRKPFDKLARAITEWISR